MSKPYRICDECGVHLDPGETCDCKRNERYIEREEVERATLRPERDAYIRDVRVAALPPSAYAERR